MGAPKANGLLAQISLMLGSLATRFSLSVLVGALALTALLVPSALRLDQDDDVIKFLPREDPDVQRFETIGRRFHGLSIAIIGFEAQDGDIFTLRRLHLLRTLALELRAIPGVSATTCFTELPDITEQVSDSGEEMSAVVDLVPDLPPLDSAATPELLQMLDEVRRRSLALDHIVGSLVAADGQAALILAQIHPDAPIKATADAIRAKVQARVAAIDAQVDLHFGGAPFIGSFAAEQTRRDLAKLSPWVCLMVILIMALTSRSLGAVIIALSCVGIGIVWVMGGMTLLGRSMTLVSSSLPVLLVALGSAYSIHLLAAILAHLDQGLPRPEAVRAGLAHAGPPVLIASLTTMAGFLSFAVMDVEPMREFGLLMAAATGLITLATFLVVTAAAMRFPLRPVKGGRAPQWALAGMQAGAHWVARHPWPALALFLSLVVGGALFTTQVRTHTENRTLFAPDSEPIRADDFLEARFGGSLYVQIEVAGDLKSPLVLRQVERLAALAESFPEVVTAQSITDVITLVGGTMIGEKRIPPSRDTVAALSTLAYTDDSVRLLVDDDWQHTLVQIKVSGADMSLAASVGHGIGKAGAHLMEPRVAVRRHQLSPAARAAEEAEISEHLRWLLAPYGVEIAPAALAGLFATATMEADREALAAVLQLNLVDDPIIDMVEDFAPEQVLDAVATALGTDALDVDRLSQLLVPYVDPAEKEHPESLHSGMRFVFEALREVSDSQVRAARAQWVLDQLGQEPPQHLREAIDRATWPLSDPVAYVPRSVDPNLEVLEEHPITMSVSGYPIIYEGMNQSVRRNQVSSLAVSALLVFLALVAFTRRPLVALCTMLPAALTILLTFGIMGAIEIPMDVGTSMIAAIALGVGIDYAVHLYWNFAKNSHAPLGERLQVMLSGTGWGIVINALEVSLGLSILYFGTVVPMRNFGLLTAAAMLFSAIASLLFLPAFLHWISRLRPRTGSSS